MQLPTTFAPIRYVHRGESGGDGRSSPKQRSWKGMECPRISANSSPLYLPVTAFLRKGHVGTYLPMQPHPGQSSLPGGHGFRCLPYQSRRGCGHQRSSLRCGMYRSCGIGPMYGMPKCPKAGRKHSHGRLQASLGHPFAANSAARWRMSGSQQPTSNA